MKLGLSIFLLVGVLAPVHALKQGNSGNAQPKSPAEQLATFTVPDGFVIELVASEAEGAIKPISLAFDDGGRLWTQTAREYPRDADLAIWQKGGRDQILVFETPCEPGAQTPRVFADGLVMPTGVLPHGTGAYVIHGPELLFMDDADGDGRTDAREVLLSGLGVQDTHTTLHQLMHAPGGWITFSQGVLASGTVTDKGGSQVPIGRGVFARMKQDGTQLEVVGAGTNNAWAWAIDREGRVFTHEANDFGYSQILWERDATYPAFFKILRYPDSMMHPPTAQGLNLGGTGFSGIAVSEFAFPAPWRGVNFVANPITGTINTVSYKTDDKGVIRFAKEADLVQCSDPMFRPVFVEFGPDGSLYIADWYNGIISHNEVPRESPHRNKTHGRIWRVRHLQKTIAPPNPAAAKTPELLSALQSENAWEQRAAWRQIERRQASDLVPQLKELVRSTRADIAIHAIWSLESLGHFDQATWAQAVASDNPQLRYEAVRALSALKVDLDVAQALTAKLPQDPSFRVRNEVLRFFRDRRAEFADSHRDFVAGFRIPKEQLPTDTVNGWKGRYLALGGAYESAFLNLLVKKALYGEGDALKVDLNRWTQTIDTVAPAANADRIAALTRFISTNPEGDLEKGEAHFKARCVHCHSDSGFAPPLAGRAAQSIEATVTAIVAPSVAMEAIFQAYRIVQKDGAIIEGYFSGIDEFAITLTFMGGGTHRVPLSSVEKAGYVAGKSVMPDNLDAGMSEADFRDLVAYLRAKPAPVATVEKIEFESLAAPTPRKGAPAHVQKPGGRFRPETLSGEHHYFMPFTEIGQAVSFSVPSKGNSPQRLGLGLTTCVDFGVFDILVNDQLVQKSVDAYSADLAVQEIDLGTHAPTGGNYTIELRLAAANSKGVGKRCFGGLDYLLIETAALLADLAADYRDRQPIPAPGGSWHFHSDTDADPLNGGLVALTHGISGHMGGTGFGGSGLVFGNRSLGPFPVVSNQGLFDGVKMPPAGHLAAHPGQASGGPEYLVIEYRPADAQDKLSLTYTIDNPRPEGDGIDFRLLTDKQLLAGKLDHDKAEGELSISDLGPGKSLWLVIGNGPGDSPGTDQTFVKLQLRGIGTIQPSAPVATPPPVASGPKALPPTKVQFRKQRLYEHYLSEGASTGDIDGDGKTDIVAGAAWWQGPLFQKAFAYEPIKNFPITGPGLSGYSSNFFTFPDELTGDVWDDIIKVSIPGRPAQLALNPGQHPQTFADCKTPGASADGPPHICNESPQYLDIIGDARKELLAFSGNRIVLFAASKGEKPTWEALPISEKSGRFPVYIHGLGAGDIDGDGLQDILEKEGWWQQPTEWDRKSPWTFHAFAFGPKQGGAQMFAYDVDGDGYSDVVTALNAHSYGFAWYEQTRQGDAISFKRHDVMTDKPEGNPYGVCFSQPHAMDCADIDGDGIKDVVTGKCYFAHNGRDPGAKEPAVLYWFRTTRHPDGSAELIPYLIDSDSGVGRQITVTDVNADGKPDIVTSNKKGVFAFIQE